jgi:hypothetical protein
MTTWPPGLVVPVPESPVVEEVVGVGAGWYRYRLLGHGPIAERLYIAAARLEHEREEAVVEFVRDGGLLVPLGNHLGAVARDGPEYVRAIALHAQKLQVEVPDLERLASASRVEFHWLEASYRLRIVRALTRHVIAHRRGHYLAPLWPDCPSEDEAWQRFKQVTDVALAPFHVRVLLRNARTGLTYDTVPSLFSALVLQLVNDLAQDVEFNICAATDCQNDFVHQEAAGTQQHRLAGVLYCSTRCKNRQLQRRHRAARRATR